MDGVRVPASDVPSVPRRREAVWDIPVRLAHWMLVVLFAFSWWTGEQHDMDRHRLSGYCIAALLLFRIFWGFTGSETARFARFVAGPAKVLRHVRSLGRGTPKQRGHNPLGSWSVVALIVLLCMMVGSGLIAVDVDGLESGPLADLVDFDRGRLAAQVHRLCFNLLLALVALHVAAILFYLFALRENLIAPMIRGTRPTGENASRPLRTPIAALIAGIVIAAAFGYAASKGFRP